MKSFNQFYEQAAAAAPAPAPAVPKPAAKAQAKAKPKVTDPSSGVDKDDRGRWQGQVVDQGKELEPEKTEVTPGRKGPDPNLPSGEANPNKKKDDEIASADWPKGRPGQPPIQAPWNKGWPTVPGGRPFTPSPGDIPGTKYPLAKNGKGTQIAQADPRGPMPDYVRDSIRRQYKGGPDYKIEDMKNVINWNKKKQA